MSTRTISILIVLLAAAALALAAGAGGVGGLAWHPHQSTSHSPPPAPPLHSEFAGEILTVLYVADVIDAVEFYTDVLGFRFDHFYDHHSGASTSNWTYDDPPLYAEMWAGPTPFALHLAKTDYQRSVGGSIHYFEVADVDAHHGAVKEHGGSPNDIIDRPWMRMFSITDPDGHRLFFQTPPTDD